MMEWKDVLLIDVTDKIGDGLHGTPIYDNSGTYHFINGNNLINGKIVIKEDTKRVNEDEFLKHAKPINERTLLLGINGTIGNVAYYNGEKCMLGKSACYINVKCEMEIGFIYYTLVNRDFQNYIEGIATGTTIPNVPLKGLREYSFKLPPLPEQTAIASVLSSLDDKIDLLHRQNATLEKMAETLFRQWFVEEAKEEWEELELGSVIETTSGGTPSRTNMRFYEDGIINWVKSKELNGSFILESEEMITEEALRKSSAKILPANSILIAMYGATVGEFAIISKEMTCNQAVCALKPNYKYPYTYLFLLIKYAKQELINMAVGSAQQNISQSLIKQLPVLNCTEVIKEFDLIVEPFFCKIKSNQTQIRTLTNLRDTLLPKLMNGEVRVNI